VKKNEYLDNQDIDGKVILNCTHGK